MAEHKTKTYSENGNVFSFDFDSFTELFEGYCKKNHLKKDAAEVIIGEKVNVSESTVHSWRFRSFAPADIETARKLADVLGAGNTSILLRQINGESNMDGLNDAQIISGKKIYDSIIDLIFDLKNNERDYYAEYYSIISEKHPELDGDELDDQYGKYEFEYELECIRKEIDNVRKVIAKEYFYLHDTKIYDQLSSFCDCELAELYLNNSGVSIDDQCYEDYCEAIKKLHAIVGTEGDTGFLSHKATVTYSESTQAASTHNDGDLPF